MKISLTIYNDNLPQVQTVLESCDLIFIPAGYSKERIDGVIAKFGAKTVCLSQIRQSEIILEYLRSTDPTALASRYQFGQADITELETIKASLPKNIELELYTKNCFFSDIPEPKPIIIKINDY